MKSKLRTFTVTCRKIIYCTISMNILPIIQTPKKKRKKVGTFKDELKGIPLEDFIDLRPNNVKKAFLSHHHYKDVLINLSTLRVK